MSDKNNLIRDPIIPFELWLDLHLQEEPPILSTTYSWSMNWETGEEEDWENYTIVLVVEDSVKVYPLDKEQVDYLLKKKLIRDKGPTRNEPKSITMIIDDALNESSQEKNPKKKSKEEMHKFRKKEQKFKQKYNLKEEK